MSLIDNLKALPKEYLGILILKIAFALLAIIGAITFLTLLTAGYLYVHNYAFHIILLSAFSIWAIPLVIIAILCAVKVRAYRKEAKMLQHLASAEALTSIGVYLINKLLRKLKPAKSLSKKSSQKSQ